MLVPSLLISQINFHLIFIKEWQWSDGRKLLDEKQIKNECIALQWIPTQRHHCTVLPSVFLVNFKTFQCIFRCTLVHCAYWCTVCTAHHTCNSQCTSCTCQICSGALMPACTAVVPLHNRVRRFGWSWTPGMEPLGFVFFCAILATLAIWIRSLTCLENASLIFE